MIAQPVILLTRDGTIAAPCHHPKPVVGVNSVFPDLARSFAPLEWPTLCSGERGLVYVKSGCLERVAWCEECVALASVEAAA